MTDIGEFTQKRWVEKPLFPTTEEITDKTHHFPSDVSQFDSHISIPSESGPGREEFEAEAEPELEAEPAPEEIVIEEQENFESPQSLSELHTIQGRSEAQDYPQADDSEHSDDVGEEKQHLPPPPQTPNAIATKNRSHADDNFPSGLSNAAEDTQTLIGNKPYPLPTPPKIPTPPPKRREEARISPQ